MRLASEKQIPSKIRAYTRTHHLGMPRIMYEPHAYSRLHIVLGPLALLVSVGIFAGYQLNYVQYFRWGPEWQTWLVLAICLAWLCIGIWILLTPLFMPHTRVYLCPQGLVYQRRRLDVIRWDSIVQLYKELNVNDKAARLLNYTVQRADGKLFVLKSDLPYLDRLGGFMERETARHLLPEAIAAYNSGSTLKFAAIQLDQQGIAVTHQSGFLSWRDFAHISCDETALSIYQNGNRRPWTTVSLSGLPNIWVLKGLTEYISKHHLRRPLITDDTAVAAKTTADNIAAIMTNPPRFSPISSSIAAYHAGCALSFGKLCINKEGVTLSDGDIFIPWAEITSLGISKSEVIVRRAGPVDQWYTIPLWSISNLPKLKQLIDYIFFQQCS